MSMYDGHRQRLRERLMNEGLENFTEEQVLELLLFYCIPRRNTKDIAYALKNHFGSMSAVLEAPVSELMKVPGVGEGTAIFLSLMLPIFRYYRVNKQKRTDFINNVESYGQKLLEQLGDKRNEEVYLLCMDSKRKMISCRKVGEGSVNSASVPIRRIVEMALADNATSVVLAHNHPSGFAVPSEEDVHTTYRLAMALSAVDIQLVDHVVVADEEFVSMVQSQYYDPRDAMAPL